LAFVPLLTSSLLIKIGIDHLHSSSAGGKDLSTDTQIGVIGPMESKICTNMLINLREKCGANFPAMTLSYSMVKIACLNDAFSEISKLEASPVEGQSLPQKDKESQEKLKKQKSLKT